MGNNMEPMHLNVPNDLKAEYEEERRVLGQMKKCFFILFPAFVILFVVMMVVSIPSLSSSYGADGIKSLVVYMPSIVLSMIPVALWAGCVPSGYIWAVRAIRRSRIFVLGNFVVLAILFILLLTIPALISPIVLFLQWRRVSRLKASLSV